MVRLGYTQGSLLNQNSRERGMSNTRHLRVAKNDISGLWEFRVDSRLISAHETYTGAEDRLYSYDTMYSVQGIATEIVLDTRGI